MPKETLDVSKLLSGGPWTLTIGGSNVGSFKSPSLTFDFSTLEHKVGYPPANDYVIKNSESATLSVNLEEWNLDNVLFFLAAARPESGCTIIAIGGGSAIPELEDIEMEIVFPDQDKKMVIHFHKGQVASGGTVTFNDEMNEWSALPLTLTILKDSDNNGELGTWYLAND